MDADADVMRMMADLGLSRRDYVSAPEDDRSRLHHHQETAILAEAENRRMQGQQAREDDPRSTVISKWNTQATFGGDDVTEALGNRYSGQGHRAALQRTVSHLKEREREERERGFAPSRRCGGPSGHSNRELGDERRLYLQERHYTSASPSDTLAGQPRPRASSPRSFGTVKFGPGSGRRKPQPLSTAPLPPDKMLQDALAMMKARAAPRATQIITQKPPQTSPTVQLPVKPKPESPQLAPAVMTHMSATPAISTGSNSSTDKSCMRESSYATTPASAQTTRVCSIQEKLQVTPVTIQAEPITVTTTTHPPLDWTTSPIATPPKKQSEPTTTIVKLSSTTTNSARLESIPSHATNNLSSPDVTKSHGHTLTATFYDVDGNWTGTQEYPIEFPVDADIDIASKQRRFGPVTELAVAMMNMSKAMHKCSRGIKGFEKSEDGLWEEVEE